MKCNMRSTLSRLLMRFMQREVLLFSQAEYEEFVSNECNSGNEIETDFALFRVIAARKRLNTRFVLSCSFQVKYLEKGQLLNIVMFEFCA